MIVLEDGSSDGSLDRLRRGLRDKNHFIIRSKDLYEVRTYSRGIAFAQGEFVVLLQDDDDFPPDLAWLDRAEEIFRADEELGVLGGLQGVTILPRLDARQKCNYTAVDTPGRLTTTSSGQERFEYVMTVNRAPMFIRREVVRQLGIDNSFAPDQCDDTDFCLRAWNEGIRVGLFDPLFPRRNAVEGGMRLYNSEGHNAQDLKNWNLVYDRHAAHLDAIALAVRDANAIRERG